MVPACDIHNIHKLERIIESTCRVKGIVGYKIGCILGLTYGLLPLVQVVRKYTDLPIIYDHQKAGTDIPYLAPDFAEVCLRAGVTGVILFPQSGPETAVAFIESILERDLVPIVGGEMTHPKYLSREGGFIKDTAPQKMYEIGAKTGVCHFVVPGNRPEMIEKYADSLSKHTDALSLLMPGIGRQGGAIKKAFEAAKGNPCYAIIGSGIYRAANMQETASRFCEEALEFGGEREHERANKQDCSNLPMEHGSNQDVGC